MKKITKKNLENLIEWVLQVIGYAIILVLITTTFDTFYIDDTHLYLYGIAATLIIFVLNKTIKPILFFLTIPITGLTVGIFYPCINLFILKLTDWILGSHFQITNIFIAFLLAILISLMNQLVENVITKPIMRRIKGNG
ncbi:MAG: phage holin family protein [Firmicutes bacterium]|nr:phage holin family protein [Bacillota bacterium]